MIRRYSVALKIDNRIIQTSVIKLLNNLIFETKYSNHVYATQILDEGIIDSMFEILDKINANFLREITL